VGGVLLHRPAPLIGGFAGVAVLVTLGEGAYRVWREADDDLRTAQAELEAFTSRPELQLVISGLYLSALGAAEHARLQLWVKAVNLGASTILHDWRLSVQIGKRVEKGDHLAGAGQRSQRAANMRALDEVTGTISFQGEVTGLIYFVLPDVTRASLKENLMETVLTLSVKDQNGVEWSVDQRLDSLGPVETGISGDR
jgi:hypothetical protein